MTSILRGGGGVKKSPFFCVFSVHKFRAKGERRGVKKSSNLADVICVSPITCRRRGAAPLQHDRLSRLFLSFISLPSLPAIFHCFSLKQQGKRGRRFGINGLAATGKLVSR